MRSNQQAVRRLIALLWAVSALTVPVSAGEIRDVKKTSVTKHVPGQMHARFTDGSTLRLTVLDVRVQLKTNFGTLVIPVAEIRYIRFATRTTTDVAKQIDAAIDELGNSQFSRRESAGEALLELREKSYLALLRAADGKNAEVAIRAKDLLTKLRDVVPNRVLTVSDQDVVHTKHSKIAGHIVAESLKVRTTQFGEQPLKLSDLKSLRSTAAVKQGSTKALPDPGNLSGYQGDVGKKYSFRITGGAAGRLGGSIYGTDVYTLDSSLAFASVHAGVLKAGQTGTVRVTIIGRQASFEASTRNGVTSSAWGDYPGAYRISR